MRMMKYTTILLTLFLVKSCGSSNTVTNLQNDNGAMENLNGNFIVSKLGVNENLSQELTLEFDNETKKVSGFSGCNRFFGNYITDGASINFKSLASTEMMCQEEANKNERQMLDILSNANSFSVIGNKLMFKKDGETLMEANPSLTPNETSKATQEDSYVLEYTAMSRGTYKMVVINNQTISKQDGHRSDKVSIDCSKKEWENIVDILKDVNLKSLENLVAPTQARLYDGAAIANFKVTYKGKVYTTQGFDHGQPPAEIKAICDKMLSLSQNIE